MTILVNVTVPEGLVLAADSRQTYTNKRGDTRVSSDNARKLYPLNDRIAAVSCGWAFLFGRSISSHISDFRLSLENADLPVEEMVKRLGETLNAQYEASLAAQHDEAVGENSFAISLLVGGYDPGGKQGKLYELYVPKGDYYELRTTDQKPGAAWRGHTPIISRLLRGHDPRIRDLEGYTEDLGKSLDEGKLGYLVDYWSMTLQDAVDFALFLANTTIQMQRFADGIGMAPGSSADCGGEIDVVVIEPVGGLSWVRSKQIKANGIWSTTNAET